MMAKAKCDFEKWDLHHDAYLMITTICRSIRLMWESDLTEGLGFLLQWFDPGLLLTGNLITYRVNIDSMRDKNLCILGWVHAKVGDRYLCTLEGLFTIEIDRDDRLVSRDVHSWWVDWGIFGRATGITTWRRDLGLCLFDSQIYGSFLFHLVAW